AGAVLGVAVLIEVAGQGILLLLSEVGRIVNAESFLQIFIGGSVGGQLGVGDFQAFGGRAALELSVLDKMLEGAFSADACGDQVGIVREVVFDVEIRRWLAGSGAQKGLCRAILQVMLFSVCHGIAGSENVQIVVQIVGRV